MHMTSNDALFGFEDGNLVLWGKVNDFLPNDTASVLTGGVWTRRRKAFGFGRLEGVIGEEAVQVRWKEEHCRRQAHVWPISRKG